MAPINTQDLIDELVFDIKTKDQIKARLVLRHLPEIDSAARKRVLFELSRADDAFVIPVLVGVLADEVDLGDSLEMINEILFSKTLDSPAVLVGQMLRETKPDLRIVMCQIVGEIRLAQAGSVLLGILNEERDEKVLRAAINALGMIGDASATTPISEYLYSNSVELVIAAIQALGQLGTPTAIQRLADKLGEDGDLDMLIVDVFACSQQSEAIEKLNATLSAHQAGLRNAGKQRLIDMGAKAVPVLMTNLRFDDPDLRIHTLNVLGAIGDEAAISAIRKLLFNEPKDPNVRFAAYEALGQLPVAKGAFALAQGLNDPVDNVRSAAASAIDRNYTTVLAAGVKNMVRDEDGATRPISRTIMDAQCSTIFLDLMDEPEFADFAVEYLSHKAHTDIRDYFVERLKAEGLGEFADRIAGQPIDQPAEPAAVVRVFAVDDSKMILNIYRSVLHNLGCEPVLFEFPAEAIQAAADQPPALIFTDLNMPEISGIDLTREVRKAFDSQQLPIIMVTTQNESQDNEAALAAGVNAILNKPFNEQSLGKALEAHLPT